MEFEPGRLLSEQGHKARQEPAPEVLSSGADFEGALQLCGRPGTCIIFHNATFHTAGPMRRVDGRRTLLYYGYVRSPWLSLLPPVLPSLMIVAALSGAPVDAGVPRAVALRQALARRAA